MGKRSWSERIQHKEKIRGESVSVKRNNGQRKGKKIINEFGFDLHQKKIQEDNEEGLDSLFKDVLCVHPSVILGQFDREDDAGDEQDAAAAETKPECVLENKSTSNHILCDFIHCCYFSLNTELLVLKHCQKDFKS